MLIVAIFAALVASAPAAACDHQVSVCTKANTSSFPLIARGRAAAIVVDATADSAVKDAANGFSSDVARVAGTAAAPLRNSPMPGQHAVLIGVLGHSLLIDDLVRRGRIAVSDIAGKWEAYRQMVVDNPFPGVRRALVIVGADRRGAAFGTYDLSEKIGVSPWHWWADVPVRRKPDLYVTAGSRADAPKVRYRGIFINDEEPAFGTWARRKFGGINAKAYAHVFDLILRLKGNYLWPAMWGKAIGADDPESMPLANSKGVVLGTSHHEPMTRAQAEWHRNKEAGVTGGAWDYTVNAENLRTFWRGGIERMMSKGDSRGYEQLVTVGMRGDGDEPMSEGTAIGLLERIVRDQRQIIVEVTGRPATQTPQVWALYKEVQYYYDRGMKVPEDVTLLFADDNWGQIRRLPTGNFDRPGGYGVYYHFDYVGGPRNYKWLNTNQIEKVWQQMDLAYRRGARAMWIVNVGDIKPMEFPTDFFLKMAWDPEAMTPAALAAWPGQWAERQFGAAEAQRIAELITDYSRLAARRKPEFVDASAWQLGEATAAMLDGGEFGRRVAEWTALERRMQTVRERIAADQRDAFFQLVEHPIRAMTNLYRLYYTVAWNRKLAATEDARANTFADEAEAAFARDRVIRDEYHALAGGKWEGMMLQTHIGYTSWQEPRADMMPKVRRVSNTGPAPPLRWAVPADARNPAVAEAPDFARTKNGAGLRWQVVPHLGRTQGAVLALPQGQPATRIEDDVRLDYRLVSARAGDATVRLHLVPAIDTRAAGGLRIAVAVDDRPPQILVADLIPDKPDWSAAVRDNVLLLDARFTSLERGPHAVKIWRLDDGMALQKVELLP